MSDISEESETLKITLIGDAAVGKSSVLLKYIDDTFDDSYVCTIGVDFKVKTITLNNTKLKLQIWDTAGQERFKPITSCYFRGSNGCLALFDLTNRDSFNNVSSWISNYRENNTYKAHKNVLMIGNKADATDERTISREDAEELARSLQCEYFEVSAKTSDNIEHVFYHLAQVIIKDKQPNPGRAEVLKKKPYKKGCCK